MIVDQALITEYKNAEYVVFADPEFVMLVDKYSAALKNLMTEKQFNQAAFITAYNPYSDRLEEVENHQRQTTLIKELTNLGLEVIQGIGRDKEIEWPGEKSVLVLNVSKDTANNLGNKYGQNAIIWVGEEAIPQLVLLDGEEKVNDLV